MLERAEFLEHARVFGNLYGTSGVWVEQQLKRGNDIILEIDWQGAQQVKRLLPQTPRRFSSCRPRARRCSNGLSSAARMTRASSQTRMNVAVEEMSHYVESDYLVVNRDFDQALDELQSIVTSQRLRSPSSRRVLSDMLQDLLN